MTDMPSQRLQTARENGRFDGTPAPEELDHFLDILMADAPDGYEPWLFRCRKESKAPATKFGSWKDESNRLTREEAKDAMREGWNIGIAGTPDDRLVNVDIDDDDATDIAAIQDSVRSRSRSRTGRHTQYFEEEGENIPNIPTDAKGEIRARWQYVLAPGSYVPTDPEEEGLDIPDPQLPLVGYYTVERPHEPTEIEYDDLPEVFRDAYEAAQQAESETPDPDEPDAGEIDTDGENTSGVFDIEVRDIIRREGGTTDPHARWSAIFHGSSTDANMSVSDKGRLHCWRHNVAHGGLQVLAVLSSETESGESACLHIGAGHKNSGAGPSRLSDGELTWPAWEYAKRSGYLPDDDPIPHTALLHLATERGLCDPDDIEDGWKLPREAFNDALEVVETEFGLSPGREAITDTDPDLSDDEQDYYVHTLEDRRIVDSIDDVDDLPSNSFVLDKPPREGGSYRIMGDFVEAGVEFLTVAPRHAILEYHVETLSELASDKYSLIHFKGSTKVCANGGGERCDAYPMDHHERQQWRTEIKNIVHKKQVITEDDCPTGLCTYWFLKEAAKMSDIVLTVPQLAKRITQDVDDPFEPEKLFIDEEQALGHYKPGSVELCTVHQSVDTNGMPSVETGDTQIHTHTDIFEEIRETIHDEQQERAEDGVTDDYRETPPERDICAALDSLDDLREVLSVTAARDALQERGEQPTLGNVIDFIQTATEEFSFPERTADPDRLKEKIEELVRPYYWQENANPGGFLEAVLFPYENNPFHFKNVEGEYTVRLIGDSEHIFYEDWLDSFDQLALIAGPEGERFLSEVKGQDACVLRVDSFRYAEDFVVLPVGRQEDGSLEAVDKQRQRCQRLIRLLNEQCHPHIAVTGTKDQAWQLHKTLRNTGDVVTDPTSPAKTLYKLWTFGATAIIYENSVVSRGIDAPFFDATVIANPGFSTPYWEARADYYKDEDTEKWREAHAVKQELTDRELTNAALRMSATYDVATMFGTKVIAAAESDVDRLKYLQDRVLPRVGTADTAATAISALTIGGDFEEQLKSVYDGVNQSEKEFIKISVLESFTELEQERPVYDMDRLGKWVENRFFTGSPLEDVRGVLAGRCGDPPSTSEVYERLPGMHDSRISAMLRILANRGEVDIVREVVDGGGKVKRWDYRGT